MHKLELKHQISRLFDQVNGPCLYQCVFACFEY